MVTVGLRGEKLLRLGMCDRYPAGCKERSHEANLKPHGEAECAKCWSCSLSRDTCAGVYLVSISLLLCSTLRVEDARLGENNLELWVPRHVREGDCSGVTPA